VFVDRSITGVPVTPISGEMSQHSPVSADGTVVIPCPGLMNDTCQSGEVCIPSASNANTLSCSVATYTTLRSPLPGMLTFARYKGEASETPSIE
jgi:hypothetical protein